MFLTPSKILYTHRDPEICCSTERSFTEMAKYVHGSTVFPKLQVVKKDGFYFTLNDAKLQVYRHLEKMGRCGSVEVEKVSLKEVPEGIRKLMTAPDILPRYKVDKEKRRRGKYHRISTAALSDINVDDSLVLSKNSIDESTEETESDTDTSESDESDGFSSEWSDEDVSATDIESSSDDDDDNKGNEVDKSGTLNNRKLKVGANDEENESFI